MKYLKSIISFVMSIFFLSVYSAGTPIEYILESYKDFPLIVYPESIQEAQQIEDLQKYAIICVPKEVESEFIQIFPCLKEDYRTLRISEQDPYFENLNVHISLFGVYYYYMQFVQLYDTVGCAKFNATQTLFVRNGFWARFCFEEYSRKIKDLTGKTLWGGTLMPSVTFNGIGALTDTGVGIIYQFYNDLDLSINWSSFYDYPDSSTEELLNDVPEDITIYDISGKILNNSSVNEVVSLKNLPASNLYIISDGKGNSKKILR